jgi:hypothetical protein
MAWIIQVSPSKTELYVYSSVKKGLLKFPDKASQKKKSLQTRHRNYEINKKNAVGFYDNLMV